MRMLFPHHRTDSAAGGTPGQLEVLAQSDETALVDAHAMLTTHHHAAIATYAHDGRGGNICPPCAQVVKGKS